MPIDSENPQHAGRGGEPSPEPPATPDRGFRGAYPYIALAVVSVGTWLMGVKFGPGTYSMRGFASPMPVLISILDTAVPLVFIVGWWRYLPVRGRLKQLFIVIIAFFIWVSTMPCL